MALDPSTIAAVPLNQVPKNLFAAELNQDLVRQLEDLKKSPYPKQFLAEAEFNQYVQVAEKIITMRRSRQFPQARALAKRGFLDSNYFPLIKKLGSSDASVQARVETAIPALTEASDLTKTLREQLEIGTKNNMKKDVFTNGNQFIWFMMAAIFGFFVGIFGYRINPNFFQKVLDHFDSQTPAATTHSSGTKLDYARWLREFEEILNRLKSTQQSHERRIEDIVKNSEKITQHALSLYADARIKNEANLEHRMSILVKEIQTQFDQSQKLQAGDRAQVNVMLEHCLGLCDAVESNSVHCDAAKLREIAQLSEAS